MNKVLALIIAGGCVAMSISMSLQLPL